MRDIKIITLDLDGTLLNSKKELTPGNERALRRAAEKGIEIVPTTGRFFTGMPEFLRELPYINYAITVNGAEVYDIKNDCVLSKAEIPWQEAVEIMRVLDRLDVVYDCYMGGWGWMTRSLQEKAADYTENIHYKRMLTQMRTPVDELKAFVAEKQQGIQKIQFFTKELSIKERMLRELPELFPDTSITSSVINNVEINTAKASKGEALRRLAAALGVDMADTMAFGDGLNDLSMIKAAGIGVAMENAIDEVKAAADYITTDCESDGVAAGIEKFCF